MIKNEKYIKILKAMISCVNHGDYYSVKELSNLELKKMQENDKQHINAIKNKNKIKKIKNKPLNTWNNEELIELIECYSEFILNKIENTENINQLQREVISIKEFIDKI